MIEYKNVTQNEYTNQGYERIVWNNGDITHRLDGHAHRIGGPAVICKDNYKAWHVNGNFHREDGPAVIHPDGHKEYWLNDIEAVPKNYHLFSPLQLAKLGLI